MKPLKAGDAIINQFEYITRPTQFPFYKLNKFSKRFPRVGNEQSRLHKILIFILNTDRRRDYFQST